MDIFKIKPGDKVFFIQDKNNIHFWYLKYIENAKNLEYNKEYTIKTKEIASSWVKITLEETGDLEYSLSWFELKD